MPDANGVHDSYSYEYEAVVVWKGKVKHCGHDCRYFKLFS